MREFLLEGIKKLNIEYTDEKINNLIKYLKLLTEYNAHTNLTALRDEKSIIEKHFLDSLLLQNLIKKEFKKAIDIGTGAGFPGMVLAIFNPNIEFTLMDSIGKKTKFLDLVKERLELHNVTVVTSRAEDYINDENRETYDLGLCRGVSKLGTILEYIIPFLKVSGEFLSQKMEGTGEEIEAENALNILKSEITETYNLQLPFSKDSRVVIRIKKTASNDKKYPRRAGIPLKRPL
ncbi:MULTISPECIES: 16S rRNA (guanine(527)-N(7))-methyltransferase RsmG [Fusobacterium]|jgi:16S rRNA (guanine527-N7)-methyltransferase|uniref:Ribosomal RNA small subunit methyltransferase G n=1 Tax=Fusobacterium varium ATCC 27725 TaxID=469618 RepID=A0ABN5JCM2_FUSVA|nr:MULTISPECIES: 16S rRNA (guanine(527)-N(7))-methyltransferase RsmG [Fusobacterium]AVQ29690.1 16S rRNA (guanine(527)-N(7))-methyltransferase RsmG [Fusobacterium varium ATCC 27725]EES64468.1 16S rRNA methyltransferase GidB [Fusobacterium varium ATCC 27725]MCF0169935.1 16S rRNA (guanine(527)-N(7))-methyltransferase RsmG [Fusobacterium varium]MCF2672873.1 16S rRNA (guanine(527)-N(7))-methyltransferase RsmG [Fusobacterium varium]MCI6033732.1 16S rRNA (guanine(527)-N(7))-methyltransferase RsmG [Fu